MNPNGLPLRSEISGSSQDCRSADERADAVQAGAERRAMSPR
jgi:hypothetical protein